MRLIASLWVFFACSMALVHAADESAPQAEDSIQFDGNVLSLASQEEAPGQSLKEYIPAGESLETWTKLASVREYDHLDDPKAVAGALIDKLKKQYPNSPSSVIQNPTTGEVIVDFVVWPPDGSFVEFDVFKYQKRAEGGLIAQQYALREYQDVEGFLKGLRPVRERLVELMADGLQPSREATEVRTKAK
jgi:hypothetical protein